MSTENSKVRIGRVAGRQWGRISRAQLRSLGIAESTIAMWLHQGYLHRRLPGVFAVGHPATSSEAQLAEALFYAGPGAMLSHATAAWWFGLLAERPRTIHVSTPRQSRSLNGVRVHGRRTLDRHWRNRFPVTTLPQTVVDFSARAPLWSIRLVLAKAEYHDTLDIPAIEAACGPGRPGSVKLREALQRHQPALAEAKSRLERIFFEICEQQRWPLPVLNRYVAGWQVDAIWEDKRIAVELDGHGNHHTPAQLRRDRQKEMDLRKAGWTPVRYSEEQLKQRHEVIADLSRLRNDP